MEARTNHDGATSSRSSRSSSIGLIMAAVTAYLEHTHVGADGSKIVELNLSLIQRIFIAGRAIWFYAWKLIAPVNLTFIYPRWESIDRAEPWLWIFPLLVLVAIVALMMLRHRIGRGPLAAVLLFCGTLVPALGFVNVYPMRFSFVADHFQYHASIALIALLAAIIWRFIGRIQPYVVSAVLLIPLMILTFRQATELRRRRNALARHAGEERSLVDGVHESRQRAGRAGSNGRGRAAVSARRWSSIRTSTIRTPTPACVYGRRGEYDRAIDEFTEALRINPRLRARVLRLGPGARAAGRYRRARSRSSARRLRHRAALSGGKLPRRAACSNGAGTDRRSDRALSHRRHVQPIDFADARYNLGVLLMQKQQFDEAMYNFIEALRVNPRYVEAWTNLAPRSCKPVTSQDAAFSFQQALQLRPGFPPAEAGLQTDARPSLSQKRLARESVSSAAA